jgi:hypothetical protein
MGPGLLQGTGQFHDSVAFDGSGPRCHFPPPQRFATFGIARNSSSKRRRSWLDLDRDARSCPNDLRSRSSVQPQLCSRAKHWTGIAGPPVQFPWSHFVSKQIYRETSFCESQVPAAADKMKPPPIFRTICPLVPSVSATTGINPVYPADRSRCSRRFGQLGNLLMLFPPAAKPLDSGCLARNFPDGERLRQRHRLTL